MDLPAHPKDYAPRGTDRVRSARHTRSTGPSRFWRSALVLLAIAFAVLALLATRARGQRDAADGRASGTTSERVGDDAARATRPG